MSRATIEQLRQLGLDSYAVNQMAIADRQAALDAASARVDSALATQFLLPILTPYPLDIIQCECVIASWTLLIARGYNPPVGNGDDNLAKMYQYWADYLDRVSKGEIVPNVNAESVAAPGASGPTVITATTRGYSERGVWPNNFPTADSDPFSSD